MTTTIAFPTLWGTFFTDRLLHQKRASPHTVASYRDTFSLLLRFTHKRLGKVPSTVTLDDLDAPMIRAFLDDLEHTRGTSARSRNVRLAAIHPFPCMTAGASHFPDPSMRSSAPYDRGGGR